jgi:membrane protease YdiL (CAAX protease family)
MNASETAIPAFMSDTPNAAGLSNPLHASCVPWGFWASTGFGILAILAWLLFQWIAAAVIFVWLGINPHSSAEEVKAVASHGAMIAAATIGAMPAAVAVLALAARLAHCRFADYLALVRPTRSDLLLGISILAVLLPLGDLTSWLTGRDIVPAFVVDAYRTARASNTVVVFILALVVAAPVMEELLFRGFLLRGYAASRLGPVGAVLLTSAAWASMHVQYEVFYVVQIFILGCVFGWLRLRSGSTTLTLILHGLVNLTAITQTVYIAERAT